MNIPVALLLFTFALNPFAMGAPTPAGNSKWEALVQKKLTVSSPKPDAIICIGSSHMERWKTVTTDLAPLTVYNHGIGGSTMKHAAELFIPKLAIPFKPRAVILYEGSNDINAGVTPEQILERFKELHRQIHNALPKTRLYVLGIVPSPGKRFNKWEAIQQANQAIKQECATEPWMKFIDTTTPLLGADGQPKAEYFIPEDIHMLPEGYKVWTGVIAPVVVEAEKEFEPKP
ncbi:MAG: GDSL-type esterase/lipase family protein [Verrucomicrobiota bacterium]